jgi:hypothetical protein
MDKRMIEEPVETIEIVFDDGTSQVFHIYFTYAYQGEQYVVYYDPKTPDDVYVKRYDDQQNLIDLTPEELAYADEIIGQYEEDEENLQK